MENNLKVTDHKSLKRRSVASTISSLAGMLLFIPAMFCEQHSTYAQVLSASEQVRIVLPNLKYSLEVKPVDWGVSKYAPKELKPLKNFKPLINTLWNN